MDTTTFQSLNLSQNILRGLDRMGFQTATPVQAQAIQPMLERRDVLVQAPTGSGKTCAFGIPAIEAVEPQNRNIQAVILCPTRELAIQTAAVLQRLTAFKPGVRIATLYGGEPIQHQINALKRRPQVIVATPGRMIDHIRRRTARLAHVHLVVLDEADRMLDMGFRGDMDTILDTVPEQRQTVLFSATLSPEIKRIATEYQTDAQMITVQQQTLTVDSVDQYYTEIGAGQKNRALTNLLRDNDFALSLVFVATKSMADKLARQLSHEGFRAGSIHGDLRQRQRDAVMKQYRTGQVDVLVATDVAARGIDVCNIDAVINYDIPDDSDSYVHRIGRTGRAGNVGNAYTLLYPKERQKLREIISATGAGVLPLDLGLPKVTAAQRPPVPFAAARPDRRANASPGGKPYRHKRQASGGKAGQKHSRRPDQTTRAGA